MAARSATTPSSARTNLGDPGNLEYVLSEGGLFGDVEAAAIDWVWSFDVFVHIAPLDMTVTLLPIHTRSPMRTSAWTVR